MHFWTQKTPQNKAWQKCSPRHKAWFFRVFWGSTKHRINLRFSSKKSTKYPVPEIPKKSKILQFSLFRKHYLFIFVWDTSCVVYSVSIKQGMICTLNFAEKALPTKHRMIYIMQFLIITKFRDFYFFIFSHFFDTHIFLCHQIFL